MLICLDAGHGGRDPGATNSILNLKESDLTLQVCNAVDIDCLRTRQDDIEVSLRERVDYANREEADLFISIHFNAAPSKQQEVSGFEVWCFKGSLQGRLYADRAIELLKQAFPETPDRGVKESSGFYVLRHTNMPAILIEVEFLSNTVAIKKFLDSGGVLKMAKILETFV